jgi:uncharacterized protein YdhG (YjbR/CyaY superfamily)
MTAAKKKASSGFSAAEKAAMKERVAESKGGTGVETLLAKIAEMGEDDRALAERVHAIVTKAAPDLEPKTWYGMPAYAKGGKVVCFFQPAGKFKARYSTLGFNDPANLDDGTMWPTAYAVTDGLTDADAKKIARLVTRAVRP